MKAGNSLVDGNNHFQTLNHAQNLAELLTGIETEGLTEGAQCALMRLQQDVAAAIEHAMGGLQHDMLQLQLESYGIDGEGLDAETARKRLSEVKEAAN